MTPGELLRDARRRHGLTQGQLAARARTSQAAISRIERGLVSPSVETLASETQRLGLQGRVTGSHLTSMHSMDNYYVSKLIPLMAVA